MHSMQQSNDSNSASIALSLDAFRSEAGAVRIGGSDGGAESSLSDAEEAEYEQPQKTPRFRTIRAPVIHVTSFTASGTSSSSSNSSRSLSGFEAARLLIAILQHLIVQLQLTSCSWAELEETQRQVRFWMRATEALSDETQRLISSLGGKRMMSSLSDVFQCILRVFVAPPSRFDSERRERHAYPHVEEVLLLFGTSAQSPTIVYRVRVAYKQDNEEQVNHVRTEEAIRALTRNVIRQLIQQSETLFPEKMPAGMRSPNTRLHVLFRLGAHPQAEMRLTRTLLSSHTVPDDENGTRMPDGMTADPNASEECDYFTYTQMMYKPDYTPRMVDSYEVLLPPEDADDSAASKRLRRRALSRASRPRACLPHTLLIGSAEQRTYMQPDTDSRQEERAPSVFHSTSSTAPPSDAASRSPSSPTDLVSAAVDVPSHASVQAPIWYQLAPRVSFVRNFPGPNFQV